MDDNNDNPYDILGVDKSSTAQQIKAAYRKLALAHHPDKQTTEQDRQTATLLFSKISNAYEILGDERARREYDQQQQEQYVHPTYSNQHYHFHDPFQVFAQVFRDEFHGSQQNGFFPPGHGFPSMFGNDPFFQQGSMFAHAFNDPFFRDPFQQMQGFQQQQQSIFSDMQRQQMQQMSYNNGGGNVQSFSSSSSSSTRMGPNGTREQINTTIINGQKTVETIITNPDGSIERHVQTNGPQQQQQLEGTASRRRLEGSARR